MALLPNNQKPGSKMCHLTWILPWSNRDPQAIVVDCTISVWTLFDVHTAHHRSFLRRAMNCGTRITGQLRQPTTSLHTWPITWDIEGCLCLFKYHSPMHTPLTDKTMCIVLQFNKKQSNDWIHKKNAISIEMSSVFLCWIYPKLSLWELTATCVGKS